MVRTVNLLRCWLQSQTSCIVQISVCVSTCLIRSHLWDWTDMLRLHTIDTFNDVNVCTNPGQLVKIIFCWSVSCIVGCAYLFLLCSQVHCHAPPSWLELDPFRIRICDDDEIETVYLFKRFIAEFRVCGDGWFNPYTLIASVEVVKVTRILIWSMKSIDLIAHKSSYMNWIPCHTQRITGYSNLNPFICAFFLLAVGPLLRNQLGRIETGFECGWFFTSQLTRLGYLVSVDPDHAHR